MKIFYTPLFPQLSRDNFPSKRSVFEYLSKIHTKEENDTKNWGHSIICELIVGYLGMEAKSTKLSDKPNGKKHDVEEFTESN